MDLTEWKDLATVVGVIVAIMTLIKGLVEYMQGTRLRRIDYFAKMKDRFLADEEFATITELLERHDPRVRELPPRAKWRYLAFFEEVALLLRAGLIRDELACYMFGYYALLCDRSDSFWSGSFEKDRAYWPLFFAFVEKMKVVERLKDEDRPVFVERLRI